MDFRDPAIGVFTSSGLHHQSDSFHYSHDILVRNSQGWCLNEIRAHVCSTEQCTFHHMRHRPSLLRYTVPIWKYKTCRRGTSKRRHQTHVRLTGLDTHQLITSKTLLGRDLAISAIPRPAMIGICSALRDLQPPPTRSSSVP